jgi:nitrogen regulatory protein PII
MEPAMKLYNVKLLTIVCEILAQKNVIDILEKHKTSGYTIYEAEGNGAKGVRGKGFKNEKNVKIETILTEKTAEKIIEDILSTLISDFAIIFYLGDVQVARTEKFT